MKGCGVVEGMGGTGEVGGSATSRWDGDGPLALLGGCEIR